MDKNDRIVERVQFPNAQKVKLLRTAAYARVSSSKDAMLHSLSAQVSYYNSFIQSNPEWLFCGVYADEALTGTKENRQNFQELLSECRAGRIDLIITKSISRFARNTVTLLETVRELKELGVDVYFEEQNIHSISPDGELMLTILASYAQEESYSASENQKWRIRKDFKFGKVSTVIMLGYKRNSEGVLEIIPEEAETVRMIFADFLNGIGRQSIANKLNELNILTKNGCQKVNEGEVPRYYVEDSHEAIIEPEEFELVQAEIARRKEIGKVYSSSNIFSTKLVCSCCGGFFGSKVWHSTSKYRRVIWQCNHKFKNGAKCTTPHLYEDVIKEKFVQVCGMVGEYKEDFLRSCRQIVDMLSDCSAFDKQIGNLQIRADELTAVMQAFIKDNAENEQDQKRYSQRFAEYEKQMNEVESNLQSLQHKKAERLSRKELLLGMISELEKTDMMIHEFDEKLWRLMVEKATVGTDGKLTFTLRNGMEIEV